MPGFEHHAHPARAENGLDLVARNRGKGRSPRAGCRKARVRIGFGREQGIEFGPHVAHLPQVSADHGQVEAGGVYFCDHCGGLGRALLGEVVARLASAFGAVTVEEL